MSDQNKVSVRLPADLHAAVEHAAAEERRTVSNLVRNLIDDWRQARRSTTEESAHG